MAQTVTNAPLPEHPYPASFEALRDGRIADISKRLVRIGSCLDPREAD